MGLFGGPKTGGDGLLAVGGILEGKKGGFGRDGSGSEDHDGGVLQGGQVWVRCQVFPTYS